MHPLLRIGIYILASYGMLVLTVFLLQRRMIYFPGRTAPSADLLAAGSLKFWPRAGDGFKGYTISHPPAESLGTLIVFHGNAGSAWHRDYFVHALAPLGYRVILAEYPGYGGRPGKTNEASLTADARAIVRQAHAEDHSPIYLLGESMGCGVAAAVAADPSAPVDGLILITPWDSLPDLAQTLYWYLPARWLTRDRFDNLHNLQHFDRPVAMVIAGRDRVVPNKHSLRLYASLSAPKRLWRFDDAGHNSWSNHIDLSWWREVMQFVAHTAVDTGQR